MYIPSYVMASWVGQLSYFLCASVPGPFSQSWYIGRLLVTLDYFALSSTSDAAPSSFVPRFQRSGDSSVLFGSFRVPVCSVLSDSLCTRLIGFSLAS